MTELEYRPPHETIAELRAEVEQQQKCIDTLYEAIGEHRDEVARLRRRIAELEDPHYVKGLRAEIEQLRIERDTALEDIERMVALIKTAYAEGCRHRGDK
jgi:rubrerythrin